MFKTNIMVGAIQKDILDSFEFKSRVNKTSPAIDPGQLFV